MGRVKIICVVISLSVLSFARANQNPKPEAAPATNGREILELPTLPRCDKSPPFNLLDKAVVDERGLCKLHHQTLKVTVIPIDYGLMPEKGREFYEAQKKLFPNATTRYEAGCLVTCVKQAEVLQCHQCLRAKAEWGRKKRSPVL